MKKEKIMEKNKEHLCVQCGKIATLKSADPYSEEIFPENGPYKEEWWCDHCYHERLDDI